MFFKFLNIYFFIYQFPRHKGYSTFTSNFMWFLLPQRWSSLFLLRSLLIQLKTLDMAKWTKIERRSQLYMELRTWVANNMPVSSLGFLTASHIPGKSLQIGASTGHKTTTTAMQSWSSQAKGLEKRMAKTRTPFDQYPPFQSNTNRTNALHTPRLPQG